MVDKETAKANEPADGGKTEPETVAKTEHEALQAKYHQLEESNKSVQRELEKARKAGGDVGALRGELVELKGQMALVSEMLADSTILDDEAKEKVRAKMSASQKRADEQTAAKKIMADAANTIGALMDAQGLTDADFTADPRFADARAAWFGGNYSDAVKLFAQAIGKPAPAKVEDNTKTNEGDIEARVNAAVEKRLKEMGVRKVDTATSTTGSTDITLAWLKQASPEERLARIGDIKKAMADGKLQET